MFNINIVATWSSVDNDCHSQGKDWTLSKQTETHYTLYNLFLPRGMPSLSNLWPPITNLSQKQKQCSIVALYSFKAAGLFGGQDDEGTRREEQGLFQSLHWESLPWSALTNTVRAPQLHSPNGTCLPIFFFGGDNQRSCPRLLPLNRRLITVRRVQRWDRRVLLCLRWLGLCLDFATGWLQAVRMQSLWCLCQKLNLVRIKNSWYDM